MVVNLPHDVYTSLSLHIPTVINSSKFNCWMNGQDTEGLQDSVVTHVI